MKHTLRRENSYAECKPGCVKVLFINNTQTCKRGLQTAHINCNGKIRRKYKMAKYRKLGRTSAQRKALIRNQVTALLNNGKIITTEAKAKEIRKVAEGLIALAVKEKDNYR